MKEYSIEVAGVKRTLPFVDINDELAFASFVVISDSELISVVAPIIANRIQDCEVIVTAEAKGIALAHEISRLLGLKKFVVARKSMKSYMRDTIKTSVKSITTTNTQDLFLDGEDIQTIKGKRVCLLDDVVSTGDSLLALETLVNKAGAIVTYKACILAEGDAADRDDLIFLQKLPLFRKTSDGEYEVLQ